MKISFKILKLILVLIVLQPARITTGQVLRDSLMLIEVKKCIDEVYNFQFSSAGSIYKTIKSKYPNIPVTYLIRGMEIYWENYPLLGNSPQRKAFEKEMRTCIGLCETRTDQENEAEYLLANLCARGLLLLYYADNDITREVIPLATSTYKYIRKSFDYVESYSDFSYFTGLYNYYREAYPEAHPVYKPLTALFPKGDRKRGLKELKNAASKSIVLKAESATFLSYIYLSYEKNYQEAVAFSQALHERYPLNQQYIGELAKNLLYMKRYDEAEKFINEHTNMSTNSYLKAQITIFNGILQEKKYHNNQSAKQLYLKGISELAAFTPYGDEIESMGYLGLSRIAGFAGNTHERNVLRKKGMDLTNFKSDPFEN